MKINIQNSSTRSPPLKFRGAVAWLLLICFIPLAAVPASADGIDDGYGWLEVLDYGSLWRNDGGYVTGNRTNVSTSDKFFYSLPYGMTLNYIDLVFDAPAITGISVGYGSWGFKSLTLTKISGNLYRAYGAIEAHTYSELEIRVTNSKSSTINIYSLRVLNGGSNMVDVKSYRWEYRQGEVSSSGSTTAATYPRSWTVPCEAPSSYCEFILTIPNSVARTYDYIDVNFSTSMGSLTAISVASNKQYIPYDSDYISAGDSNYWVCSTIRIDLTDFISETSDVFVRFEGASPERDWMFTLQGIKGIVNIRYLDPELHWYQQIFDALTSSGTILAQIRTSLEAMAGVVGNMYAYLSSTLTGLLNSINSSINNGFQNLVIVVQSFKTSVESKFDELISILSPDTSESDQTADELAQRGEEIGGLNQQIGAMQRPDVGSINADFSQYLSGGSNLPGVVLAPVLNSPSILAIFSISFLFMLASYVLFGKR